MRHFIMILLGLFPTTLVAQHTVDFNVSATVCVGESLAIADNSDKGVNQSWSFCSAVEGTYTSMSNGSIVSAFAGMSIIENQGAWYGFAVSRDNQLIQVKFGDSPFNTSYALKSLGNPGSLFSGPDWIHVIASGNKWYGLVTNQNNNEVIRLVWTSLEDVPQAQSLQLATSGKIDLPTQVEIEQDGNNYVAIVANTGSRKLTLINFGTSMDNMPSGADVINSPDFPGASNMFGVTAQRVCDQWEIYTTVTNKLFKVNAGATLFNAIDPSQIVDFSADIPVTIGSYNRLKSISDSGKTYVYFSSYTSGIISAAVWKPGATNADFMDLTAVTVPNHIYTLEVFKHDNRYGIYGGSFDTGALSLIEIDPICSASMETSTETIPQSIYYTAAGTYPVTLTVSFSDGTSCSYSQDVVVTAAQAPDINFNSANVCAQHDINFTTLNNSGDILNYAWDFDDTQTSGLEDPVHQFTAGGTYVVNLTVTASNGCQNRINKTLTVYNEPVVDFILPGLGTVCTNQLFNFQNTTTFDSGLTPSWQWQVDGVNAGVQENLSRSFSAVDAYDVKLTASIPGCTDEITKVFSVVEQGPTVDFDIVGACEDSVIQFTNTTSGDVISVTWDFGDGQSSTSYNTQHTYETPDVMEVSLIATTVQGCENSSTKSLTIYSSPVPSFSLDLPPFSCSGAPSQFHDLTPPPSDSNLQFWAWTFGDGATSTTRNPAHTYALAGDHSVELTVTSDQGCQGTFLSTVNIAQTPVTNFNFSTACVNQAAQFTDASGSNIATWNWKIHNSTYTVQNPVHVFLTAGKYNVELTTVGTNSCVNTIIREVNVPVAPTVDFLVENACSGQEVFFTQNIVSPTDPVQSFEWGFEGTTKVGPSASHLFSDAGTYPVTLSMVSLAGCSYAVNRNISISQSPVAAFQVSSESGPPPLTVQFTNTSIGAASYLWKFNDVSVSESNVTSPQYTFNVLGDYVVDLTAVSNVGCAVTVSKITHVIIPKTEMAMESFDLLPDDRTGNLRAVIQVRNNGNYTVSDFFILLDIGSGIQFREQINQFIAPGAVGSVVLANQLAVSSVAAGFICVSIEITGDTVSTNNKLCNSFTADPVFFNPYPNPATGTLTVEMIAPSPGTTRLYMVDALGKVVYEKSVITQTGLNSWVMDISGQSPGVYVLRSETGASHVSRRIVVR